MPAPLLAAPMFKEADEGLPLAHLESERRGIRLATSRAMDDAVTRTFGASCLGPRPHTDCCKHASPRAVTQRPSSKPPS